MGACSASVPAVPIQGLWSMPKQTKSNNCLNRFWPTVPGQRLSHKRALATGIWAPGALAGEGPRAHHTYTHAHMQKHA
eukprot:7694836-Lingulodinium_polyedra.AAC.1